MCEKYIIDNLKYAKNITFKAGEESSKDLNENDKFIYGDKIKSNSDMKYSMEEKYLEDHKKFMKEAINEAKKAYSIKETPIGAVVVYDGQIVGRGFNSIEIENNSIKHAEIIAIEEASKNLGRWRLNGCDLYVTMEPCVMCCGAIVNSRVERIIIGASHTKNHIVDKHNMYKNDVYADFRIDVVEGIMKEECSNLLSSFFKEKRNKKI